MTVRRVLLRAAAAGGLLVVAVMLVAVLFHDLRQAADVAEREARDQVVAVTAVLSSTAERGPVTAVVVRLPLGAQGRLAVHLPGGTTVGASRAPEAAVRAARRNAETSVSVGDLTIRLRPVATPSGIAVVEYREAAPDRRLPAALGRVWHVAVVGLAAVAAGVLLVRRATTTTVDALHVIATDADALESSSAAPRLDPRAPVELHRIGNALDRIRLRWLTLRTDERRVMADLSHRLRTPLTALRLDSEALGDDPVAERIRLSVAALGNEVDQVITSVDTGTDPSSTAGLAESDVTEVVRERMVFWRALTDDQFRPVEVVLPVSAARVPINAGELSAVLDALLVNVFQHTPPATALAVTVVANAGWVTLVVDDAGPGFADPRAALRRRASDQGSTGLGLDIAHTAARSAGGSLHLERAALGGARIRLRLPQTDAVRSPSAPLAMRLWRGPDGSRR